MNVLNKKLMSVSGMYGGRLKEVLYEVTDLSCQ